MARGEARDGEELPDLLPQPDLRLGFLACAPLLFLYELGLAFGGGAIGRNGAEKLLTLALSPFPAQTVLRIVLVVSLLGIAWAGLRRTDRSLRAAVGAVWLEGLVAALLLGPLLVAMLGLFDARGLSWNLPAGPPADAPELARTCRLVGAAVWEELLCRVGVYGLVFLLVVRTLHFFGLARPMAAWSAELSALLGSSVFFAAFHLRPVQGWLGRPGDPFDPSVFLWRLLAGLLLAALFRWRGVGVSAWAHGLFNLGLSLGAGPGVFRSG